MLNRICSSGLYVPRKNFAVRKNPTVQSGIEHFLIAFEYYMRGVSQAHARAHAQTHTHTHTYIRERERELNYMGIL